MKLNIKNPFNPANHLIRLIRLITVLTMVQIFFSCNDVWKGEQYIKYISFVNSGYTNTYLNTNTPDGVVHYQIPVEVSGSAINDHDISVTLAIDPDTLIAYNKATYFTRTDLYELQLDSTHYSFPKGMTVVIPAGKCTGNLPIDFRPGDMDMVEKYVLPLTIASTSEYIPSPKRYYKKTLMRIVPFNYFSGTYSASAANITAENISDQTTVATREMRYVSDSAVFFYAGLCDENARDRASYKVRVQFNADGTLTFTADNPNIQFTPILTSTNNGVTSNRCVWTETREMDALQPFLEIRTITMNIKYSYYDISNPNYTVKYTVDGYYTLERRRNTQIPEEDMQEIFDW